MDRDSGVDRIGVCLEQTNVERLRRHAAMEAEITDHIWSVIEFCAEERSQSVELQSFEKLEGERRIVFPEDHP